MLNKNSVWQSSFSNWQPLINTVQNYNPETELLLLINENGRIEINLLQNMAVFPAECSRQVQQRQSEFQLDHFSSKKNS